MLPDRVFGFYMSEDAPFLTLEIIEADEEPFVQLEEPFVQLGVVCEVHQKRYAFLICFGPDPSPDFMLSYSEDPSGPCNCAMNAAQWYLHSPFSKEKGATVRMCAGDADEFSRNVWKTQYQKNLPQFDPDTPRADVVEAGKSWVLCDYEYDPFADEPTVTPVMDCGDDDVEIVIGKT